ncbi:DEAD/DEAH box helicase [Salipaludibacillus neizhouensis]|uniref:DEAD/DEAH box helicase n=1 Tax=Salipaludibacillus neizhouensis TaxID=885475 RepID=A0A3A9KVR3_9BACI|nr:DEAD/DEAH box helicase [Salipaludibacillus neizhouensis]RKL68696.1 DEAD/DEAH box helicase [Salipaludibacillus neizhouensis]
MKHNFERFELKSFLIEALKDNGINLPTEIQERLIPAIKNGQDVIGRSHTGTGKTLAFLLPILHNVDPASKTTQHIIAAPTRELATQLYEVFTSYSQTSEDPITTSLVVGGTDRLRMIEKVKNQPHVIIGTPGRILDMLNQQALKPSAIKTFVVDEADQMLDMGFIEDVDLIASRLGEDLQLLVFSATIPEKLKPFLQKYMKNPKQIEVEAKGASPTRMEHWLVPDRDRDREDLLVRIAKKVNPFLAIIFTNTKDSANKVFSRLQKEGLNVDCIHGGVPARNRKKVLKKLQDAEIQYLVATDLVARGIDIKGISHIINYEIPKELEYYVHRVGRTARAGWDGIAITLYGRDDQNSIERLEKQKINFKYTELKKDEWTTIEKRSFQVQNRSVKSDDKGANAKIKLPKKVKPGYKKKAKQQMERDATRQRRLNRKK